MRSLTDRQRAILGALYPRGLRLPQLREAVGVELDCPPSLAEDVAREVKALKRAGLVEHDALNVFWRLTASGALIAAAEDLRLFCGECGRSLMVRNRDVRGFDVRNLSEVPPGATGPVGGVFPCPFCVRDRGGHHAMRRGPRTIRAPRLEAHWRQISIGAVVTDWSFLATADGEVWLRRLKTGEAAGPYWWSRAARRVKVLEPRKGHPRQERTERPLPWPGDTPEAALLAAVSEVLRAERLRGKGAPHAA